jgi:DNA topoisomerase I
MWKKELRHDGVLFPKAYDYKGLRLRRRGSTSSLRLSPLAEEYGVLYGKLLLRRNKNRLDAQFDANFWRDWVPMLPQGVRRSVTMKNSAGPRDWDFGKLAQDFNNVRMNNVDNNNKEDKYRQVIVDGKKHDVARGILMVDAPGIYMSHNVASAYRGRIRRRLSTRDVTLNRTGPVHDSDIDTPWGSIIADNSVQWIASWKDAITGKTKYIFLDSLSKKNRDQLKFDRAIQYGHMRSELMRRCVRTVLSDVERKKELQLALCFLLLDAFAVRPGHDRDGLTRGLVSLRVENVHVDLATFKLRLEFLGKDSIPYVGSSTIQRNVLRVMKTHVIDGKAKQAFLFDAIDASSLNTFLSTLMPGLTAKVIRTYHASRELEETLLRAEKRGFAVRSDEKPEGSLNPKTLKLLPVAKHVFRLAAIKAAAMCNHQQVTKQCSRDIDPKVTFAKNVGVDVISDRIESKLFAKSFSFSFSSPNPKDTACWAPNTTLSNYIDPRIVYAYCLRHGLDARDLVPPRLLNKTRWASAAAGGGAFRFVRA